MKFYALRTEPQLKLWYLEDFMNEQTKNNERINHEWVNLGKSYHSELVVHCATQKGQWIDWQHATHGR